MTTYPNTYHVNIREVWIQTYEVKANSKEEALAKARMGAAHCLDGALEYSHMAEDQSVDNVEEV